MADNVQVQGAQRLALTLRAAAIRVQDMSDPGAKAAAMIAARGRAGAPVRTGRLLSSVRSSAGRDEATVTGTTEYAARTHWGYRRYGQAPQPFLATPAHALEPAWRALYADECQRVLGTVKGV